MNPRVLLHCHEKENSHVANSRHNPVAYQQTSPKTRSTSSPRPFLAADFCLGSDESHVEIDISENGATKRRYLQHLNG